MEQNVDSTTASPDTIPYLCPACGVPLVKQYDADWGMICWVCPNGDYKEPV